MIFEEAASVDRQDGTVTTGLPYPLVMGPGGMGAGPRAARVHRRGALVAATALPAVVALATLAYGGGCSSNGTADAPSDAGPDTAVGVTVDPPPADAGPQGCDADKADDGMWRHLRCAGLYDDFDAKHVAPGVRPYKPALEHWSDGAAKQRWLSLPAGTQIDTSNVDEWVFPNGTKAFKEFRLDGKRVETRLYEKGSDGQWRHASFLWNADETDAVRDDNGVKIPRGGPDVPPYQIPTPNECNDCHIGRTDRLLGVEAVQLGLSGAEGVTLATLVADGLVTVPPASTSLALPEDATGKAVSALGFLHANCGHCHNRASAANGEKSRVYTLTRASDLLSPDGGVATVTALDAYTSTVGHATTFAIPDAGGATFLVIKAGDPASSLVSYLSGRRVPATGTPNEKEQMPPIVTRIVDTDGHAALDAWIAALPP
jgi:hypothetical protein